MTRQILSAALIALLPATGFAGSLDQPDINAVAVPVAPAPTPDLIFTLRGGVAGSPTYFGSDSYEASPDFALGFQFLRLPGGRGIGSEDGAPAYGLAPRGSLRVVKERTASKSPELADLNNVDLAVELGLGLGYTQRNFEAFGVARYGVVGHEAWVGEFGADVIARPSDRLTLSAGPRLFLGDDSYAATYFGVTPAEALASGGAFAAFAPAGGALSAGFEVGMTYELNDDWGISGAVRYDRLLNDAADSPITAQGSPDQFSVRLGLTRKITLDF